MFTNIRLTLWVSLLAVFASNPLHAEKLASIIIDDVGNNLEHGRNIIELPVDLTIAILPGTTYARDLARLATDKRKEVMLHLPMQSVEHHDHAPGRLDLHMTNQEFRHQLRQNLNSFPYIRGVNNHMGSLLTRHPGHMAWLMDELSKQGGLYFIDSKTTNKSIAGQIALEYDIPNMSRDFFLDPDGEEGTLRRQFDRFIDKVNSRGYALAIAHPYPKTIRFLQQHIGELEQAGITVIPVSELIKTAAKNSTKDSGDHHVACTGTACSRL
jgi:polysaccharide deacetylase 2 family uncharacterized protein YibQ